MNSHTVHIIDFNDTYKRLTGERNQFTVDWLVRDIETAIEGGDLPSQFQLNGNQDELRRSRIDDLYVDTLVQSLGKSMFLKKLDLSSNRIGDEGAKIIGKFLATANKSLQSLSLASNQITADGTLVLVDSLIHNKTLRSFDISYNCLGQAAGMRLASVLQVNLTLHHLNVAGTELSAAPLIALSTVLKNNDALRSVDLSDNIPGGNVQRGLSGSLVQDVAMHLSGMMKSNATLGEIGLRKMGFGDAEVVEWIAPALKTNRALRRVDLSCNRISRDGGVALAYALHVHPTIECLTLSHNAIQDEGAIALAGMLMHNTVNSVAAPSSDSASIRSNDRDRPNPALQTGVLQRIDVDHNHIGNAGLRALAEALAATLETKDRVDYLSVWGNRWDAISCSSFASLIGSRLLPGNIDVKFYEVDGRVNVAHAAR